MDYTPWFIFVNVNSKKIKMVTNNLFKIVIIMLFILPLNACSLCCSKDENMNTTKETLCSDDCTAKNSKVKMSCKLTSPELQERKKTVIASLRKQMLLKKELHNGYAFKFTGTDKVLDELTEFIKTERECCDFFTFAISVSGDKREAWLELTGPDGIKDFILSELEL